MCVEWDEDGRWRLKVLENGFCDGGGGPKFCWW